MSVKQTWKQTKCSVIHNVITVFFFFFFCNARHIYSKTAGISIYFRCIYNAWLGKMYKSNHSDAIIQAGIYNMRNCASLFKGSFLLLAIYPKILRCRNYKLSFILLYRIHKQYLHQRNRIIIYSI